MMNKDVLLRCAPNAKSHRISTMNSECLLNISIKCDSVVYVCLPSVNI